MYYVIIFSFQFTFSISIWTCKTCVYSRHLLAQFYLQWVLGFTLTKDMRLDAKHPFLCRKPLGCVRRRGRGLVHRFNFINDASRFLLSKSFWVPVARMCSLRSSCGAKSASMRYVQAWVPVFFLIKKCSWVPEMEKDAGSARAACANFSQLC